MVNYTRVLDADQRVGVEVHINYILSGESTQRVNAKEFQQLMRDMILNCNKH